MKEGQETKVLNTSTELTDSPGAVVVRIQLFLNKANAKNKQLARANAELQAANEALVAKLAALKAKYENA